MAEDLAGRVALVTGSGRGLGRAYALALARQGCAVVVNSPPRDGRASALDVAAEIAAAGGRAFTHIGSTADGDGARAAVDAAIAAFGRLDILVANAGVVLNKPFPETSDDDLRAMLDIHVAGPFAAVRHALPAMLERGWGRVVLTGSGSAAFGLENQSAYAAAKAAMTGLANVLALETAGTGVLINVVLPVAPPLGRTPASLQIAALFEGRTERLDPAWVAPLVCLLAGDACPGSGGVYSAVGGRYARVHATIGDGWVAPGEEPPGPAAMAANVEAILASGPWHRPGSILEEIEIAAKAANLPAG